MLHIARTLGELNFSRLMDVYLEGNLEKAEEGFTLLEAEQDFYRYLKDVFFRVQGAVYCVWLENGSYVSALRLEPYQDGWLLEALETAPEHRHKGYAHLLVDAVTKLPGYGKIYSHIHRKNKASRVVHLSCGFRKLLDYSVYIDGSVNSYADTYCFDQTE